MTQHAPLLPLLIPFAAALLQMLMPLARQRQVAALSAALSIASTLWLLVLCDAGPLRVYALGDWQPPFGIVLVADRLAALMVFCCALLAAACVAYASAGADAHGRNFHPLFQLQLLGINGAFLTADLFNLFVFFEIMLTASYGLLLHGSGWPRVRAALHYVAINLLASSMFLLGAAVLFGITGTLNMADMAGKIALIPQSDRGLLHAGAALLAMAFLAKAAIWPLNFWLPAAYSAASPPVAALFTVMTKVGLYAILRLWTLLFPPSALGSELFGHQVLVWGGILTLGLASVGMLASQNLGRLAGFSVLASSGTLLAVFGFGQARLTAGALYYLASSTLALCALFLVTDLIARSRQEEEKVPTIRFGAALLPFSPNPPTANPETNLDDNERPLFGQPIPAALAVLGVAFILCALLVAGLPPLSGFVGKVTMMTALLNSNGLGIYSESPGAETWIVLALFIFSGLTATIAYTRAGIRFFWSPRGRPAPHLKRIEVAPIAMLLGLCLLLAVRAGAVLRYTETTAFHLHSPHAYIEAVMAASVKPGPTSSPPPASTPRPAASGVSP